MKAVLVIDMPPTCYDCPLAMRQYETLATSNKHKRHSFACVITHKTITSTRKSRFCPLVIDKLSFTCKATEEMLKNGWRSENEID